MGQSLRQGLRQGLRNTKLAVYFATRVLYRASIGRTRLGKPIVAGLERLGVVSSTDAQLATSFALGVFRRHFRGTALGNLAQKFVQGAAGIGAGEVRVAASSAALLDSRRLTPRRSVGYLPPAGLFDPFRPLNCVVDATLAAEPTVNILLPSLAPQHLSGGPNTALIIGHMLAASGVRVRLVSCDGRIDKDPAKLFQHIALLTGSSERHGIGVADASDRAKPFVIGPFDHFMATAWWTAQMAKYAMAQTAFDRFFYLIQDYEPILAPASSSHALALETYDLPHVPIVNTRLLHDFLVAERIGQFADAQFARDALVFEPAVDRSLFHPAARARGSARRTLLFYARPTSGLRNLFEIGVAALQKVAQEGLLPKERWQVLGIGERIEPMPLTAEVDLEPAPWLGYDAYARQLQSADVLLSLMLAPHPSYPPLEMAACGNWVVTNSFRTKTAQALERLSPNLLVSAPTIEGVAARLAEAIARAEKGERAAGVLNLPSSWTESLEPIRRALPEKVWALRKARHPGRPLTPPAADASTDYAAFRSLRLEARRRARGTTRDSPPAISLLTSVYNTPAAFLRELIASVLLQDGDPVFEWILVDNGSTNRETSAELEAVSWHPSVRLHRVEQNAGIVGGMRLCLECATGDYVVPLDSDDVIAPDTIRVLGDAIARNGFPDLLYTDEDKVYDGVLRDAYFKPDWDPVLFVNSCYIAHLCAIKREKALTLRLYDDAKAEGCHDWDSFLRFALHGARPAHIPEILYSWRMHHGSTSSNIGSKPFVGESHRHVLDKFRSALPDAPRFEVVPSPLFNGTPDWWFRRKPDGAPPPGSLLLEGALRPADLLARLEAMPAEVDLVHVTWQGVRIQAGDWAWEARGLMEQFPDTVVVGGLVHDGRRVVAAELVFGFGDGWGSPHRGRAVDDPGYFAQLKKQHSVSAVSSAHCVVRRSFLQSALPTLIENDVPLECLGPWLGALARRAARRVVYTPFLPAIAKAAPEENPPPGAVGWFLDCFSDLVPETAFYSRRLGLAANEGYLPADAHRRDAHLRRLYGNADHYASWLEHHVSGRAARFPLPAQVPALCLLTTVYSGTDAGLFEELRASALQQTSAFDQWVIVAHGDVQKPMAAALDRLAADRRIVVHREPRDLGISGAMRLAASLAAGDYVVPVDADDVLFSDALQILACEIERRARPELLYSDEDLLIDGRPVAPYRRPDFDPVLNLESSYIWHLCAIRRDGVSRFGLYTDPAATWAHDWDTVLRIHEGGGRIEHVPEILYHWRRHASSTSNSGSATNERSLSSVRHLLGSRAREGFTVAMFPLDRGAGEPYLACALQDAQAAQAAFVLVADAGIECDAGSVMAEAARLMWLHADVVAVGGRICSADGTVLQGPHVRDRFGRLAAPYCGLRSEDPGPYAIALKPHSVDRIPGALAVVRRSFLEAHAIHLEECREWSEKIVRLCDLAAAAGQRVVYSPLIQGTTRFDAMDEDRPRAAANGASILGLAAYVGRHGVRS